MYARVHEWLRVHFSPFTIPDLLSARSISQLAFKKTPSIPAASGPLPFGVSHREMRKTCEYSKTNAQTCVLIAASFHVHHPRIGPLEPANGAAESQANTGAHIQSGRGGEHTKVYTHSFVDNLAVQTECNWAPRRTVNVIMVSDGSLESQSGISSRPLDGRGTLTARCSLRRYNCTQFNGAQNVHFTQCCHFNGLFSFFLVSFSLYFSLSPSLSVRFSQFPRQTRTPVRRLPSTQSGQTSKYTTSVSDSTVVSVSLKMSSGAIARCWSILGCGCRRLICVAIIAERKPTICSGFFICFIFAAGKRTSSGHS